MPAAGAVVDESALGNKRVESAKMNAATRTVALL